MQSKVIDFTIEALKRRSARYLEKGDVDAHNTIEALIIGYEEGLWSIEWQDGEPLFKALLPEDHALESYLSRDPLENTYGPTYAFEPDFGYDMADGYQISFEPDDLNVTANNYTGFWADD